MTRICRFVRSKLEVIVDVVEIHRKPHFIHSLDLKVIMAACHHAGRRYGADIKLDAKAIAIADIAIDVINKGVSGSKVGTKEDFTMLRDPARPNCGYSRRSRRPARKAGGATREPMCLAIVFGPSSGHFRLRSMKRWMETNEATHSSKQAVPGRAVIASRSMENHG